MTSYARYRAVFRGKIGSGQTWSWGLTIASTGTATQAILSSACTAYKTHFQTYWNATYGLGKYNAAAVIATGVDLYHYLPGASSANLQAQSDFSSPLPGVGTITALPQRTACVASLLTGLPGRTNRGRSYLPATALNLQADLQFNSTDLLNLTGGYGVFLDAINDEAATPGPTVIVIPSALATVPPVVNGIRVDSLPDNQLRRSDKSGAIYTNTAVIS